MKELFNLKLVFLIFNFFPDLIKEAEASSPFFKVNYKVSELRPQGSHVVEGNVGERKALNALITSFYSLAYWGRTMKGKSIRPVANLCCYSF